MYAVFECAVYTQLLEPTSHMLLVHSDLQLTPELLVCKRAEERNKNEMHAFKKALNHTVKRMHRLLRSSSQQLETGRKCFSSLCLNELSSREKQAKPVRVLSSLLAAAEKKVNQQTNQQKYFESTPMWKLCTGGL